MKAKLKQAVTDALDSLDQFLRLDDKKNKDLYIILVNGKRTVLNSGKSVWPGIGPAKCALRNHISGILYTALGVRDNKIKNDDGTLDYHTTRKIMKEAENEWIKKHVMFVSLCKWLATQKKLSK